MEGVITKKFGDKVLFDNFHLAVPDGELTLIKGPSGCGKTTLLRMLAGLEPIDGGDISAFLSKRPSMAFQEPRLIENWTALENISLVTEDLPKAVSLLDELGLGSDILQTSKFSGGMKTRVSLIRSLLATYDFLLLDEPFAGLDPEMKEKVVTLLLREVKNKTVLLVTHDSQELDSFLQKNVINLQK
jgi:ABC-type nitrate/sulfonate/bicarbonate transport system, ATPase component